MSRDFKGGRSGGSGRGGGRGGGRGSGRGGGDRSGYRSGGGGRGSGRGGSGRQGERQGERSGGSNFRSGGSRPGGRGGGRGSGGGDLSQATYTSIDVDKLPKVQVTIPEKSRLSVPSKPGVLGKPIKLLTNCVPLILPSGTFYQYDVKFNPEIENPRIRGALIGQHDDSLLKKNNNAYVYDGNAILYTKLPLSKEKSHKFELICISKNDKQKYQLTIKFTNSLTSTSVSQEVLMLFNIIFRRAVKSLKLQQIGRNHYNLKLGKDIPEHNVKIIPGLLSTSYLTSSGLLQNVDIIFKTLRTDTVLDMWEDYQSKYGDRAQSKFSDEMSRKIVLCSYRSRTVHIDSIEWKKTPKDTFKKRDGKSISYYQYYLDQYKIKIKDLRQPLLVHKPKKHQDRIEYYVPELCSLTGITDEMRNDFQVMRDIKSKTILGPNARISDITKFVKGSTTNPEFSKVLSEWQFKIDDRLIKVDGRVLERQKIFFGKNQTIMTDEKAQWDIRSTPLYQGVEIKDWCIVYPQRAEKDVDNFLRDLFKVSVPLGVKFNTKYKEVSPKKDDADGYKEALEKNVKGRYQFVMVILPDLWDGPRKKCYDTVKKYLCTDVPIPSQCVCHKTIKNNKGLLSKATKIVVQIASKLGGSPWILDIKVPGPTMICGMDVHHSGEKVFKTKSSIVGFTATLNKTMTSYYSTILPNKPGQELVTELKPILRDALNEFKKGNNVFPSHIIFYRDGVGEGQVEDVMKNELGALKKSFKELKIDVKITFLVVLKRIHMRLFHGDNDLKNPPPGTVVDTGITNKDSLEFFMVSQNVNQGSATPTRYQCIYNDAGFGASYLQTLTFKLCHMYFNWFGTVRVPSVCMYAHKLAFLVGQSVKGEDKQKRISNRLYYL